MNHRNVLNIASLLALLALQACSTTGDNTNDNTHAAHHGAAHLQNAEPDELGRQLYGSQHTMDAAMLAEMRGIDVFAGYTDEQITHVMGLMGSDYTWPVSAAEQKGKTGVLILVHGLGDHGDALLREALQPTGKAYPTTLALGMSMMTSDHIQMGINDLEAAGAREIVVVPVVSTRHNDLMRQWDYIFALRDDAAYARVPRVSSSAEMRVAEALDDHPLVGSMVNDYAREISQQPENEYVIIVAHGPVDAEENRQQLQMLENVADYLRANSGFAAVSVATLQDDAPPEVRMARTRELRERVEQANAQGRDVLIVTTLLGTRIVQSSLARNLRGLDYRFNGKGLIEHPQFIEWINWSIENAE
jgi:sirohydrochlorin ferrochelatase